MHASSVGQRSKTEKHLAFARDRLHVASKEGDRVQYQCLKMGSGGGGRNDFVAMRIVLVTCGTSWDDASELLRTTWAARETIKCERTPKRIKKHAGFSTTKCFMWHHMGRKNYKTRKPWALPVSLSAYAIGAGTFEALFMSGPFSLTFRFTPSDRRLPPFQPG